jgi:hypothetical protein
MVSIASSDLPCAAREEVAANSAGQSKVKMSVFGI